MHSRPQILILQVNSSCAVKVVEKYQTGAGSSMLDFAFHVMLLLNPEATVKFFFPIF